MPKLILDGDARGAVQATAAVGKETKKLGQDVTNVGNLYAAQNQKIIASLRQQKAEQANVANTYSAFNAKVAQGLERERQIRAYVNEGMVKYRRQLEGISVTQQQAFGSGAVGNLATFFKSFIGPASLLGGAIAGLRAYHAEIDAIITKMRGESGGIAELAQLAIEHPDPVAAFQGFSGEALGAIRAGAIPSRSFNDAGKLISALVGASLNQRDRDYLVSLASSGVVSNVQDLAPSIAALQASFPHLTAQDIVGKGLATAKVGSSRIDQLIKEVGVAAPAARQLGFGPDFILAAGAVLDRAMASASEGATRLESFMRQFERFGLQAFPQLAGQGPIEVLRHIQSKGLDRPSLEKFVGNRAEAIQGVRLLIQNLPQVEQLMRDAGAAGANQIAQQFATLPRTVPELLAAEAGRRAEGLQEVSTLPLATVPALYQSVREERRARRRVEVTAGTRSGFGAELANFNDWFWFNLARAIPGQGVERATLNFETERHNVSQQLQRDIRDTLQSIDGKTRSVPLAPGRQE